MTKEQIEKIYEGYEIQEEVYQEPLPAYPDIKFIRAYLNPNEEFGDYARIGGIEIANVLCWLSAAVIEKGYNAKIIDAQALKLSHNKVAEIVAKEKPKYVGISSTTLSFAESGELAKKIKALNKDIIIIHGGPHITAVPQDMKNNPEIDIGVIGEGERTIVELLDALKNSKDLSKVKGIIYRKDGEIRTTEPRELIKNLDELPLPAWGLLPNIKKYYFPPAWTMHQKSSALIITSRGCPNRCTFCHRAVFGNYYRFHSPEYVMKMIKELYHRYGVRHFRIFDDNLMVHKKRLEDICNLIIKSKLKITWSCFGRVDNIDEGIVKLMKKAGCFQITFGVESGNQNILDEIKKGITLEQIESAVKITRKAKIKTIASIIFGLPLETTETMQNTIDFCKKAKFDDFKSGFLLPLPATEIYENIDKYGKFDKNSKNTIYEEPVFIQYGLTKEQLIYYDKKGVMDFYLQPRIIFSYLTRLRSFSDIKAFFSGGFIILSLLLKNIKKLLDVK